AAVHVEGDRWRATAPRLRAAGRLVTGLSLFAEVETLARGTDYAFAGGADYRVTGGVRVDSDHLGAAAAVRTAQPGAGGSAWGGSFLVRASGDRYPAAIELGHVERVAISDIASDRDFVSLSVRLRALADDAAVAGVLLKIGEPGVGLARIEELRDLVALLRQRGKRTFAYTVFPSTRDYYLASACDTIIVHPAWAISVNGLAQNVTFYKKAMDRLGVDVQLVRIAEYKGAMEPFVMDQQSEPVRQNKDAILDDVFQRLVGAVVEDRRRAGAAGAGAAAAGLTADRLRALIDRGLFTPPEAQAAGLVDVVADETDLPAL